MLEFNISFRSHQRELTKKDLVITSLPFEFNRERCADKPAKGFTSLWLQSSDTTAHLIKVLVIHVFILFNWIL